MNTQQSTITLVLFVLEPLILRKLLLRRAAKYPEQVFRLIQRMHWILLLLSLATVAGAVAGSHEWLLIHFSAPSAN